MTRGERGAPVAAVGLRQLCRRRKHHEFWPDAVSVLGDATIRGDRVHGPGHLTDLYLVALAVARGGRFVTFDDGIALSAVRRARAEHLVVL